MSNIKMIRAFTDFRAAEHDLKELSLYVDLEESNYATNSSAIRKITLSACALLENHFSLVEESLLDEMRKNNITPYKQLKGQESYASYIFKYMLRAGYPLVHLQARIQATTFEPWKIDHDLINKDSFYKLPLKFEFWDIYNSYKHKTDISDSEDPQYLKAAIDSVCALFSIHIFLTSNTTTSLFWSTTDFINISLPDVTHAQTIYAKQQSLRAQIWG